MARGYYSGLIESKNHNMRPIMHHLLAAALYTPVEWGIHQLRCGMYDECMKEEYQWPSNIAFSPVNHPRISSVTGKVQEVVQGTQLIQMFEYLLCRFERKVLPRLVFLPQGYNSLCVKSPVPEHGPQKRPGEQCDKTTAKVLRFLLTEKGRKDLVEGNKVSLVTSSGNPLGVLCR